MPKGSEALALERGVAQAPTPQSTGNPGGWSRGSGKRLIRYLVRNPVTTLALLLLVALSLAAVFAPTIAPYDPFRINPRAAMQPPSAEHWFGTDHIGRDVFSRVIWGGRDSLRVGLISATIAAVGGTVLGLLSGFFGGLLSSVIMRAMDLLLAFPGVLLALAIVATLGPGLDNVMIAVGVGAIPIFTRVVHGSVLPIKQMDFVQAAVALGSSDLRVLLRHVVPNVMAPVIVLFTLQMGAAIFSASALSFIGLGAQPPSPEWGAMVSRGRDALSDAFWMTMFPGLAIALVIISINVVGDSLRDVLDPRAMTR